jgi:hypothetical protein
LLAPPPPSLFPAMLAGCHIVFVVLKYFISLWGEHIGVAQEYANFFGFGTAFDAATA